jgi:hypothetical protein
MRFILKGNAYELTREEVERMMVGIQPETTRQYFIIINGKKFPPKQIIAKALNLRKAQFTTMNATNILERLGFKLQWFE